MWSIKNKEMKSLFSLQSHYKHFYSDCSSWSKSFKPWNIPAAVNITSLFNKLHEDNNGDKGRECQVSCN